MVDQCTCCQHAGPISNHTGLSQGTRPPGKEGSEAAQISQFLGEGQSWPLAPPRAALCPEELLVQLNCLVQPPLLPHCQPCPVPRAPLLLPLF